MLTGEQDETSLYIVSDVRFVQKPDEPGLSMRILMIDTSGKRTIWAGLDRGNLVDPVVLENQRRHDEHLSSGVVSWLEEHDWQTLDALSVVAGPGSYTGLRVGVSFAVAFALAKEIPLVRLDHFQLEAARLKRGNALVMLPARKRIVRISLLRSGNPPEPLEKSLETSVDQLPNYGRRKFIPLGDGYELYREAIDPQISGNLATSRPILSRELAMARLTKYYWNRQEFTFPLEMDVDYGSEFEPTLRKKRETAQ